MSNDDDLVGWSEVQTEDVGTIDLSLEAIPVSWKGFTHAEKVQRLVDVVQHQLTKVRSGTFNPAKGEQVAALALEGQLELAPFYADAEFSAKNAKHLVEFAEAEKEINIADEANDKKVKITQAAISRMASISDEVKGAKKHMVGLEKEHKKWRYVYDTLRESHIFFRNIGKL